MSRISELQLANFRGASKPVSVAFDTAKPITIIFGENGTGKTTLVDAIELVAKGTFGSIADKGLGAAVHKYVRTQGAATALQVELATQAGHRWQATLAGKNAQVTEITPACVLPPIEILRRRKLIDLIEAQPATRYQTLKHFLDIRAIEQNETTLRQQSTPLEQRWVSATTARDATYQTLTDTWQNMRQPHEVALSMEDWVQARLAHDPLESRTQADQLHHALESLSGFTQAAAGWPAVATACREARATVEREQKLLTQAADRLPQLIDVLDKAARYVQPTDTACPVCEQPRNGQELSATLSARLFELREVVARQAAHRQAEAHWRTCAATARSRYDQLATAASRTRQALTTVGKLISVTPESLETQTWPEMLTDEQLTTDTLFDGLVTTLTGYVATVREKYDEVTVQVELYDNLQDQHTRFEQAETEVATTFAIQDTFKKAIKIAEQCRKAFIQRVLDSITQEINDLYEKVHPDEKLGISRMEMEANRTGSIQQRLRFQGLDLAEPPQAYLSESHLDTLGFCIWLALAKRAGAIVVLDDIFTSVDAPHFRRITELLHQQAPHFPQVILTTHNRALYEHYKRGHTAEVQLLKLERWTLTHGVRVFAEQIALTELEDIINVAPFQRQAVASQAGIILETLLDEIAGTFGCSLPHKRGAAYTLGELLSGTNKLLQVAQVQRVRRHPNGQIVQPVALEAPIEIKKLLADLNQFTKIRNEVGCHFNPDGADFTDQDVADFGKATLAFAKALICPTCGQLPQKEMGTFRGCRCPNPNHKTRFTPMVKPS